MAKNEALNVAAWAVFAGGLMLSACGSLPVDEENENRAETEAAPRVQAQAVGFAAIKQAAAAGDKDSQYQVGVWYEENHPGSPRDLVRAYAWYKLAMNQGDLGAKYALERFEAQLTEQQRAAAEALVARWQPGDTLGK